MSGTSQSDLRSPEGVEQAASTLWVITGMPDDARKVESSDRGHALAGHALRFQDPWRADEHRSFWSANLTFEWPHTSGRTSCIWPIGRRGGNRESLAAAAAFAVYEGLDIDAALSVVGLSRNAGNRPAIRSLALKYADCFRILFGHGRLIKVPSGFGRRLPRVVTDADYSGIEWLTGHSTLPHGVPAYRTEELSIDAYLRAHARVAAVLCGRTDSTSMRAVVAAYAAWVGAPAA